MNGTSMATPTKVKADQTDAVRRGQAGDQGEHPDHEHRSANDGAPTQRRLLDHGVVAHGRDGWHPAGSAGRENHRCDRYEGTHHDRDDDGPRQNAQALRRYGQAEGAQEAIKTGRQGDAD